MPLPMPLPLRLPMRRRHTAPAAPAAPAAGGQVRDRMRDQVRAHVAFTRSADHTAASAVALSGVNPAAGACLGIVAARRVRACAADSIDVAVIRALVCGATWPEIAAALNQDEPWVRDTYAPAYERWKAGQPAPWRPAGVELVGLPDLP